MKAREAYSGKGYEVDYRDVEKDRSLVDEMVVRSEGRKRVPVIIDGKKVTIGYGGT
jgi:glutaredoxin